MSKRDETQVPERDCTVRTGLYGPLLTGVSIRNWLHLSFKNLFMGAKRLDVNCTETSRRRRRVSGSTGVVIGRVTPWVTPKESKSNVKEVRQYTERP